MRVWQKKQSIAQPKPCVACKGTDVILDRVAICSTAKCKGCGYTVTVKTIGATEAALRRAWNNETTRLRGELRAIHTRIGELRKLGIY